MVQFVAVIAPDPVMLIVEAVSPESSAIRQLSPVVMVVEVIAASALVACIPGSMPLSPRPETREKKSWRGAEATAV